MSDVPAFRRGADEAEKAAQFSGTFARTHFFKIEDKEKAVIRMLTEADSWIIVDQYQFIPTKPKPEGWEGNWPSHMGAVSRSDPALKGMFENDYIAEFMRKPDGKPYKPSPRTWALACLREEVVGDGSEEKGGEAYKGKVVGYRDQTREVTRKKESGEEETTIEKVIVVINMGYKNFFSPFDGFYRTYGTLLDRDYVVMRKGEGMSTDYQIAPLDPIGYDVRDPEVAKRYGLVAKDGHVEPGPDCPVRLETVILNMASDDYYGRFFDPRVTTTQNRGGGASADQQGKPEADVTDDRIREMAERIKGYSGNGDTSAEPDPDNATGTATATEVPQAPVGQRNFD
jgi:hypothetical protein